MANKDFRKNKPDTQDFQFGSNIKAEKAKADKRTTEFTSSLGNKFKIVRWTHGETFDKLPTIANLLFVPNMIVGIEEANSTGDVDYSISVVGLFRQMQDLEFQDFVKDLLGSTYLGNSKEPVDFEESFATPTEILEVVQEVLQANFTMDLCVLMQGMATQLLGVSNLNKALTTTSQPSTQP